MVHRRLSVGRTRANGKRDAQASSAVGLLRRHLIPYSRRGVRDTAHRVHRHTYLRGGTIARARVYTRLREERRIHTRASFHSVPFRHSIRAARLASKLSPVLGSPRHRTPRCAGFMPPFVCDACTRVLMYARTRACRRLAADVLQSVGTDCQHS